MLSKAQVIEMIKSYYSSVDNLDMTTAVSIFHEDVEWIHTQVLEHDQFVRDKGSDRLRGKNQVESLLQGRKESLAKLRVRHVLEDLVLEGNKGALTP
jgi:hypothetical protein